MRNSRNDHYICFGPNNIYVNNIGNHDNGKDDSGGSDNTDNSNGNNGTKIIEIMAI